jgi:hypothetical protein
VRERIASRTAKPSIQRSCACASGGDCGCGGKKKIQRKRRDLDVSEPHDPLELEADRVAEAAMNGGAASISDGTARIARAAEPEAAASPLPAGLASSSGAPLPERERAEFESRMGHDFSRVRIYDDGAAHALASSYAARAFTYGSNVFFGAGELDLHGSRGRLLLAHELAHTVQQADAPDIQRKVTDDYPKLKKLLSYSFGDWKIWDREAHTALEILEALDETDLIDTVAKMEEDGIVDRLFDNVAEEDREGFAVVLQRVQNARVHKVKKGETETNVVDSCTPENRSALNRFGGEAISWISAAETALGAFIMEPAAAANRPAGAALQRHFHTTDIAFATRVKSRLASLSTDIAIGSVPARCTAPTDISCGKTAIAYTTADNSAVFFCADYFNRSDDQSIETYIHEFSHAYLPQVGGRGTITDRAYRSNRLYAFLTPAEALDNADSHSEFVRELAKNRAYDEPEQTEVKDCTTGQVDQARRAVARAERWVGAARSALYEERPSFHAGYAHLRKMHFGTDDPKELPKLRERFDDIKEKFTSEISIECESGGVCDKAETGSSTTGYYRYFIRRFGTLHLCPAFFTLDKDGRITEMLTLAVMNATGLDEPEAERYAFLARDLTLKYWAAPPQLIPGQAG